VAPQRSHDAQRRLPGADDSGVLHAFVVRCHGPHGNERPPVAADDKQHCRSGQRSGVSWLETPCILPVQQPADVGMTRSGVRPHDYSQRRKGEYAIVKFSLQADLASLFTWNTKQVFVYVTAEWPSGQNDTNEAVIWDRIITAPSTDFLSELSAAAQTKLRRGARDRNMKQDSR
jgi:hypothetical protein